MAGEPLDLDILQTAITSDIAATFPELKTVEFYAEYRQGMQLPACLLELTEWQDFTDPDPGTEQLSVVARFEAHLIIDGVKTKQAKHSIRKLAAALSLFLRLRRWNDVENSGKKIPTGPAEFLGAYHDQFNPALDQFECWRVEWQQIIHLGSNVWGDDGAIPQRVFVGIAPNIGFGHEDDYIEVTDPTTP